MPDDICDFLMATFNREAEMTVSAVSRQSKVEEVRTIIDDQKEPVYVGAQHLALNDNNYLYDSVIAELDYIIRDKIFEYNEEQIWNLMTDDENVGIF